MADPTRNPDRPERRFAHLFVALALLAIALRIALPGLHTHACGHDHGHARAVSITGSIAIGAPVHQCSCGLDHGPAEREVPSGTDRVEDGTECGHVCFACELEMGTPCGFAPSVDWQLARGALDHDRVDVTSQVRARPVRIPPSRAPPAAAEA